MSLKGFHILFIIFAFLSGCATGDPRLQGTWKSHKVPMPVEMVKVTQTQTVKVPTHTQLQAGPAPSQMPEWRGRDPQQSPQTLGRLLSLPAPPDEAAAPCPALWRRGGGGWIAWKARPSASTSASH